MEPPATPPSPNPREDNNIPPSNTNNNDDDASYAIAAAEVSTMQAPAAMTAMDNIHQSTLHPNNTAGNRTTAPEDAFNPEGNPNWELLDEGAEMVRVRFLEFLQLYTETIPGGSEGEMLSQFSTNNSVNDPSNQDGQDDEHEQRYYPYLFQASNIAKHVLLSHDLLAPNENEPQHVHPTTTLFVDYNHVLNYNVELAEAIECELERFEPYLRRALMFFLKSEFPELGVFMGGENGAGGGSMFFAVAFYNYPSISAIRNLRMEQIGRLTSFSGTITRTSEVRPELLTATFRCGKCGLMSPPLKQEYYYTKPTLCRNPRCDNHGNTSNSDENWILEQSKCEFVDWQKLRVQENSDEIPAGSMPRSVDVVIRNDFCESAKAGDQCVFMGCLVVIPDNHALSRTGEAVTSSKQWDGGNMGVRGLKVLGVRELTYRTCFIAHSIMPLTVVAMQHHASNENGGISQSTILDAMLNSILSERKSDKNQGMTTAEEVAMEFTDEERDDIRRMKGTPQLYTKMANSIAPSVFGHPEVKRGVLLMLLGGVHKTTTVGMKLRGDINVCIVGDPSTAKSQFLKYVHSFLPRTVYTSGKASSAAGLTASVMRDQDTGEYCIEAGALMLADHGICCIDEFDKMDVTDQVAIHEAMEQQTISITKAGITATLNARASILAAANPIFGRYDRSRTLKANVALSAPIMSRFDLFFVVLDECDELADYNVAKHILDVHRGVEEAMQPEFEKEQLQRYIRFAKTLNPVITEESKRFLVECYRGLRQGDTLGRGRTAYRITVRQLESMIRLSEALARLHLDDQVRPAYVREACRLLRKSIIHVETEDVTFDDEEDGMNFGDGDGEEDEQDLEQQRGNDGEGDGDVGGSNKRQREQHTGEYNPTEHLPEQVQPEGEDTSTVVASIETKKSKKKKLKTQITFEQYESIANAMAVYLRSREEESKEDDDSSSPTYLTWGQAVNWYLEQCEGEIGDSMEELERLKKLTNLVLKRLIEKDHVLMYVGNSDGPVENRIIAVHPNYVVS